MSLYGITAESTENNPLIEQEWARKAMKHAEVYYNLISSTNPRLIKLTTFDDEIYTAFKKSFPDINVAELTEDDLKSPKSKEAWRNFIKEYEQKVADFNFGTLLRKSSTGEYTEENTMLVVRLQFVAIEIARNKEGKNDVFNSRSNGDPVKST